MHFDNFRTKSVKIGKDRKSKKVSDAFGKRLTEMHPAFSGLRPKLFLISDIYRVDTDIAEVHADTARSPIYPCYLK